VTGARSRDPKLAPTLPRRPWDLKDTLAVVAVTAGAGLIRVIGLTRPAGFVFDEFYAADGCWYVYGSESLCLTDQEISAVHPPLGKWLIGLGIRLFGFSPGGWRIASAVAGTLTVAALYVLARRLFASTFAAVVAASLLAVDFLHVVLSRTAMLDVFVTGFAVLAFLFLVLDRDASTEGPTRRTAGGVIRPWRLSAGLAAGAAAASKWSGWPFLATVLILTTVGEINVRRRDGNGRAVARTLLEEGPSIVVGLVVAPVLVYLISYAGRLDGSFLAWPWSEGSWVRAFVDRQLFMLDFHVGLEGQHPYASPAWSWLLLKRPVLFYFTETGGHGYQEILATGNPLVWWTSLVALVSLALPWGRHGSLRGSRGIILGGFVTALAPWLVLMGARQATFLYLVLPAVPFMCLALGAVAAPMGRTWIGRGVVAAFVAAAVGLFLFYHPLLTGVPQGYASWRDRLVFADCGQGQPKGQLRPQTEPGPAPAGWCWV
jgi:dolichyl-phosphate-mannose-protein mannosyltransferase